MKEYLVRCGLFDRKRKFTICKDFIEFESSDRKEDEFIRLNCDDIVDFKHRIEWIEWYKFVVGKKYSMTFKDKDNLELKVVFKNYFRKNKDYYNIYADVLNASWDYFQHRIVSGYLDRINDAETLKLQGISIDHLGVKLKDHDILIEWKDLETTSYYTYYVLYQKGAPENHVRVGWNEYGSETLSSVVKAMKSTV